jgi:hypothetical protein
MSTSLDALIHAVLDGEASAAQRAELDRRIEADPAVRARFEEVQRVFAMLEAVPDVDPPAGLVESILGRAKVRGVRPEISRQPLARPNVIAAYPGDARAIRPSRSTRGNWVSTLVHFLKEIGMNEQNPGFLGTNRGKLLVTAGVAAVALVAISTVIDFPVGGTSTTGTIVPATRHVAPQNSAGDINIGLPPAVTATPGAATQAASTDAAGQAGKIALGVAANSAELKVAAKMQNAADQKANLMMQSAAEQKASIMVQSAAEQKASLMMQNAAEQKASLLRQ